MRLPSPLTRPPGKFSVRHVAPAPGTSHRLGGGPPRFHPTLRSQVSGAAVGIPVVSEIGSSTLNFGVHIDANLGIVIGF